MKVTTIRLRKLVSTPHGYGHHAVELEGVVEPGESYEDAVEALRIQVETQLRQAGERETLCSTLDEMRSAVVYQEKRLASIKAEIEANRAIISNHGKLQDLAQRHGIAWDDNGDALLPV